MLRFLVGIAGLVVVAAGGLYFWKNFEDQRVAQQQSEIAARHYECSQALRRLKSASKTTEDGSIAVMCAKEGYLTADDLVGAGFILN